MKNFKLQILTVLIIQLFLFESAFSFIENKKVEGNILNYSENSNNRVEQPRKRKRGLRKRRKGKRRKAGYREIYGGQSRVFARRNYRRGRRGGCYYLSRNRKKVYVPRSFCSR